MAVPADVAKTDLPSLQLLPAFRSASAAVTCRDSWPSSGTAAGAPAIEVPGLGALNTGGDVEDVSVACGSAGSCVAGGGYTNGGRQGFVAVERHGRWGRAIEVPGLGALNAGKSAGVTSLSCFPAGNCAAAGSYSAGPLCRLGGVRGQRGQRPLGHGDRGTRPGNAEQGR